jgi:hypothetical protein
LCIASYISVAFPLLEAPSAAFFFLSQSAI